jgi:hypothetical protein
MRLLLVGLLALPALVGSMPSTKMAVPRAAHTATLLPSGRVLVVGGCTADSCELDERGATSELFDPATSRFGPGPQLSAPRVGHVAALLPDGSVLVAGGWLPTGLTASAERYDPASGAFVPAGRMTTPRGSPIATRLADGRVLIAGGSGDRGVLRSAEVYDPRTGTFVPTGQLAVGRGAHAAVALRDGRVLVIGGSDGRHVLASTELYDPRFGRFQPGPRLVTARHKHAAVALRDGSVLVVGGSDERDGFGRYDSAELWKPGWPRFRPAGRMANRRYKLADAVARLADGRVLVAGGARELERYDPRTRRFEAAGRIGAELAFSTATLLRDGRVLVAGGYDERIRVTRTAWIIPTG